MFKSATVDEFAHEENTERKKKEPGRVPWKTPTFKNWKENEEFKTVAEQLQKYKTNSTIS